MSDSHQGPGQGPSPGPGPDPDRTPGVEPGGVPPGETPPGEGGLSGAGPRETHNPTRGWAKGPLVLIALVVLLFAVGFLAYAVYV
ncbi:DUF6480 family protein [Streptomyces sp. NRRL F-5135]|uniref:DUF6480 family protein n=1 Tax=Streptomyces sp. NRRL F-5135 TaxID=1463858 RepID=UPI0004C5D41D|nr:DUF6480 family protein [Streptomyces sp. NRRL F-5135]